MQTRANPCVSGSASGDILRAPVCLQEGKEGRRKGGWSKSGGRIIRIGWMETKVGDGGDRGERGVLVYWN